MRPTYFARALALAAVLAAAVLALATPAQATGPACAAYTYVGGGSLCADFPGDADRNCDDVLWQVTVGKTDPWGLDGRGPAKGNGIGCEGNPVKPKPSTSPSTSPSANPSASLSTSASASPSPSVSTSASATPSATSAGPVLPSATRTSTSPTATVPADAGPSLPVTGPGIGTFVAVGGGVLLLGVAVLLGVRRGRRHFQA